MVNKETFETERDEILLVIELVLPCKIKKKKFRENYDYMDNTEPVKTEIKLQMSLSYLHALLPTRFPLVFT